MVSGGIELPSGHFVMSMMPYGRELLPNNCDHYPDAR